MQLPHNDSPLARWRINLRECLSYTILVNCPEQIHYVNENLTDMQCVELLDTLQQNHNLVEGAIPTSVFTVAITHYTTLALDEGLKASASIEDGVGPISQLHDNVEEWGLRPRLLSTELIRKRTVILLTDSGAIIHRRKKGNKSFPQSFLRSSKNLTDPWTQLLVSCESGADWKRWTTTLREFINEHGSVMEKCGDGKQRFHCHVAVIVFDT